MSSASPEFSVIVPTCHRSEVLGECLDRLSPNRQTLAAERYEVIVTDDGSRSTAEALVREKFPWTHWTAGPRCGPAANRNHGVRAARGDWLIFIDDDCQPEPGWLAAFAADATGEVLEGKTVCPGWSDSPFEEQIENLAGGVLWSCNFAIRRAAFTALGGFDEDFREACGEDMELHARIVRSGRVVRFCPDAIVVHPPRATGLRGVWRRTLLHRWQILLMLKINPELRAAPLPILCARLALAEVTNRLRATVQLVTRYDPARWRARLFWCAWNWINLPFMLPWLFVWAARFRAAAGPCTPAHPPA